MMNRLQKIDGFQFDNYFSFDKNVGTKACVEPDLLLPYRNFDLTFTCYVPGLQFIRQHFFIHRLQQSGAERSMSRETTVEHRLRQFVLRFFHVTLSFFANFAHFARDNYNRISSLRTTVSCFQKRSSRSG